MNRKQINDLVAEHVMGYVRSKFKGQEGWGTKDQHWWYSHFNPSGDISDAWKVVGKFKNNRTVDVCSRAIGGVDCYIQGTGASAETAPMAICLAALKVMGINYELS